MESIPEAKGYLLHNTCKTCCLNICLKLKHINTYSFLHIIYIGWRRLRKLKINLFESLQFKNFNGPGRYWFFNNFDQGINNTLIQNLVDLTMYELYLGTCMPHNFKSVLNYFRPNWLNHNSKHHIHIIYSIYLLRN